MNYQLIALNRGPEIATNVFIQDRLPPNVQLQNLSLSQGGNVILTNGVLFCSMGNLPRGSNAIVNLTVTALADGRLTNTIVVGSDLADLRDTNNTASAISTVIEPGALFNTTPIVLSDGVPCTPYPSVIHVDGVSGVVGRVAVTLSELSHSFPADLDVLLVSPSGVACLLMSDVGEGFDVSSVTLRLDDDAPGTIPSGPLRTGRYRPTNIGGGDTFLPPAPAGPYAETLSIFNGTQPNGDWSLYIMDDQGADSGVLAGGWRLVIQTGAEVPGPELMISLEGSTVAITWPDPSLGYVLETTERIGTNAIWTSVSDVPVSSGGRLRVNLPVGTGNHYYRLRKGSP